ncbi:MAG TPA: amino acid permease, partial [Anaerolineae bacterium]|nr:amino acid permease [Anaerolineae bacterium]
MAAAVRRFLIGDPIPTAHELYHRLSKVQALAVFSSDALSSVAYATEEILLVLVLAGTGALQLSLPIALAIAALLAIVGSSYYQTIHGYPSGGGAYIVAYDNLGKAPGLIAAAALLIDYTLTVAVSITAGVAAVTSAVPSLYAFRVELCLVAIAF